MTLEYEGTRYRGWQEQANARTVAGEVREALERVAGRVLDLGGAGRTDAGVHALAQVAHARLARTMDAEALRLAVNDILPPDIHVLAASRADERFHARHSAARRSYVYQIARRRTAFGKRFVWWVRRPLDVPTMARAAASLAGRHDFARFCERPDAQASTIVVVEAAQVGEDEALVLVRIVASHFLWKMVRRIVGALVEVASGSLSLEAFEDLIDGGAAPPGSGQPAQWTAPPSGLFLERV